MPRQKQFNQEEALIKAMELFWEKGYASTSLNDLTARLSISKGSFYDTFHGKRAIFDKALALYRTANVEKAATLLNSEADVKIGMRKLCELSIESAIADSKYKGCFIANTCSELAARDSEIKSLLDDHNKVMYDLIYNYLKKGGLKKGKDLQGITNLFITLLTGINVEVKYKRGKQQFLKSIDLVLKLLD